MNHEPSDEVRMEGAKWRVSCRAHVGTLREGSCYGAVRATILVIVFLLAAPILAVDIWAISLFFQDAPADARTKLFGVSEMAVSTVFGAAIVSVPLLCAIVVLYQILSVIFDAADALIDISRKMDP